MRPFLICVIWCKYQQYDMDTLQRAHGFISLRRNGRTAVRPYDASHIVACFSVFIYVETFFFDTTGNADADGIFQY